MTVIIQLKVLEAAIFATGFESRWNRMYSRELAAARLDEDSPPNLRLPVARAVADLIAKENLRTPASI